MSNNQITLALVIQSLGFYFFPDLKIQDGTDEPVCRAEIENKHMDTKGGKWQGGGVVVG